MAPTASRIRTSFDPEHELPRLHQWFAENPHPSRLTLQMYVKELNSLPSRQSSRKPLEVHNLCYWFKNARAAYKRAEMRMRRESAEPNRAAANSLHPHHHFSCQPHAQHQCQQQQQQQQPKHNQHHLASHPVHLSCHHSNSCSSSSNSHKNSNNNHLPSNNSSSPSPSGSPPASCALGGSLVGVDAQMAALKLAAATVPPVAVANLAAAASLKSLLAATSRSLRPPELNAPVAISSPVVPPLAPFSELDTDRSLYLLLFFMKFFDLDQQGRQTWNMTQHID